jgi:putative colanic acid biosynthesis glycosyltransferase WcaI
VALRILVLTQWYPPEPAMLLQELAQTLLARGHDVTVLTGFPNYPSGRLYSGYHMRPWEREVLAGVPVVRVPLYPDHSRSGIRRTLNYASFALASTVLGPWLVKQPDVIFVYHPPLTIGLPAIILSWLWRAPFVLQIQDLWPETLNATGMLNNPRLLRWVGEFAQWVYSRATTILVISPGFRHNLLAKGVPEEKVRYISNWVDTDMYHPAEPDAGLAEELGLAGRFNVMFAGNVGEAQGLETVIEAADLLRDDEEIQFVIVGEGIALPRLQEVTRARNLGNVRFLGRYPAQSMARLYALADVLLVHLRDDPLFRITIPHKVLAYLASGKPVLAAVSGDVADMVTGEQAGVACPPSDPVALAAAVRQLRGLGANELHWLGEHGLMAARTKYAREIVIARIEDVLLNAAKPRD